MKDFMPQIMNDVVLPLVTLVATVIVAWLSKKAAGWFDLKQEDAARKTLDTALQNAANLIVQGTKTLAQGAAYVNDRVPEARDRLKIDENQISDMVSSRIPAAKVAEVVPETTSPVINVPTPATPGT